jgi:acid phosphatase type 7
MKKAVILIISLLILCVLATGYLIFAQKYFFTNQSESILLLAPEKEATIIAIGDISCAPTEKPSAEMCQFPKLVGAIKQENPDALLLLGDLQYNEGEYANFKQIFEPLIGDLKAKSYPVPGNHEYVTKNAAGYFKFWQDSDHIPAQGRDATKGYYSYSLKDWHMVALNSDCENVGGCDAGSAQGAWIKQDLSTNPTRCTLAYWHHPAVSSGKHGDNPDSTKRGLYFWQELYEAKADIILNGHDHLYERFARQNNKFGLDHFNGIRQFTVGTGGRSLYKLLAPTKANHEAGVDSTFGYLKLVLYKTSYTWQFIGLDGKVLDNGSSNCSI